MGDEGHNRNKAGSLHLPQAAGAADRPDSRRDDAVRMPRCCSFIGDNALSVLNPVMAACKAMADAAQGVEGSTIVTTMARNGTDFGIRVSGLGERAMVHRSGRGPGRACSSRASRRRMRTRISATAPSRRRPASAALPWRPRRPSSPSWAARPGMR